MTGKLRNIRRISRNIQTVLTDFDVEEGFFHLRKKV